MARTPFITALFACLPFRPFLRAYNFTGNRDTMLKIPTQCIFCPNFKNLISKLLYLAELWRYGAPNIAFHLWRLLDFWHLDPGGSTNFYQVSDIFYIYNIWWAHFAPTNLWTLNNFHYNIVGVQTLSRGKKKNQNFDVFRVDLWPCLTPPMNLKIFF